MFDGGVSDDEWRERCREKTIVTIEDGIKCCLITKITEDPRSWEGEIPRQTIISNERKWAEDIKLSIIIIAMITSLFIKIVFIYYSRMCWKKLIIWVNSVQFNKFFLTY